jgi:membrane protein implicated in regulation of membrane protease activity
MAWVWIWAAVIVLTVVLEIVTTELVCIWWAGGAIASLVLALCGVPYWIQLIVFVVVSIAMLIVLRKVFLKLLGKDKEKTNLDSLIGKKFPLLQPIEKHKAGVIKINDVTWRCEDKFGKPHTVGEEVEIVEFLGNKIIVKGEN